MRRARPLLAVGLVAVAVALLGDRAAGALRYERQAVLEGQVWRLLTCHLVHLGWSHLLLNLTAGALVAAVLRSFAFARVLLPAALGVGLGLLLLSPGVGWYVGLSGVLHGLLACGAFAAGLAGNWGGWGALALLAVKLAYEGLWGPFPGSGNLAGGPVVLESHLYGTLASLPLAPLLRRNQLR